MSSSGGAIGQVWRANELATSADLHAGDAVLPALDEARERELDGLAAAPAGVELLAGLVLDTDVVDVDDATGPGLVALTDDQVDDQENTP